MAQISINIPGIDEPLWVDESFKSLPKEHQDAIVSDAASKYQQGIRSSLGGSDYTTGPSLADTATDVGKSAGVGLAQAAVNVPMMVPNLASAGERGMDYLFKKFMPAPIPGPQPDIGPGSLTQGAQELGRKAVGLLTNDYVPQTTAGKYARTATEFAGGAALGGGNIPLNVLRYGVAPGVASEFAGQLVEGKPIEPWVRAGTALATGAVGGLSTTPAAATRAVAGATRGAGDAQINDAINLMREAQARNTPITWPEALQQVTGGATPAGNLQRMVEGTKGGSAVTKPFFAGRPEANATAMDQYLNTINPPVMPSTAGLTAQRAAEGALGNVNQNINLAEQPYYQAASTRSVHPNDLAQITQDPAFQRAAQNVWDDPIRSRDIANMGPTQVPVLIAVRQELARMEGNALRPGAGLDPDRALARNITPARQQLDAIITNAAPEYGQALGVGAGLRETQLDPLRVGPIGDIARSTDIQSQGKALFPPTPPEGMPAETTRAMGLLGQANPNAPPIIVRQHLASEFAKANQARNAAPGYNPAEWNAARFAAQIAGNPIQRDTLQAGISSLPGGPASAQELNTLLDVFRAQGQRQRPGSLTAFNARGLEDMAAASPSRALGEAVATANPVGLWQNLKDNFERMRLERRSEELARGILSDPEESLRLLERARRNAPERGFQRGILSLLMGSQPALRPNQ
jgi:hypothetical protein